MTHYKLKVSCILKVCEDMNCLQNSPGVRISCSNFKWHIDEKSAFSPMASRCIFTRQCVKTAVCEDRRYCLFTGVTWPPPTGCTTFWLTEGMCGYSSVSLLAHSFSGRLQMPDMMQLRYSEYTIKSEKNIGIFIWIMQVKTRIK